MTVASNAMMYILKASIAGFFILGTVMAEPQLLLNYTGHLPECPTWSAEENALYWADILEGEIHRYHLPTAEHTVLSFHEEVGVSPCANAAALSSRCEAASGFPINTACCSAKSVITRRIRSLRVSMMGEPITGASSTPDLLGTG
ncbi:SMP-30/gluconolaconase/LRE-like region-containing protein [Enterobacter cloacae]|uniref:SMP-30/gluconolaconase/LRE-like region-containing protein n=1 Tax=Enterobacter cloacae TaxID=550 RepID=A0A377LUR4_ENTCL|nr:SMP-30/gluconolaconase/LRE-like region-containing protein [Enterobacter cloacae]